MTHLQAPAVAFVGDLVSLDANARDERPQPVLHARPYQVDIVVAGEERHQVASRRELLERLESLAMSGDDQIYARQRFNLGCPKLVEVAPVEVRPHLDEFE